MLTPPGSNFGWLWRRLRLRLDRGHGPTLGVVTGDPRNLGDRSLAKALVRALPGCRLEPYLFLPKERWLARFGLSGGRLFDGVVVGGGTLINDMALRPVRIARQQGLPVWIMGTGAGRGSYLLAEEPDMAEWQDLLPQCEQVAVRGPISVRRLELAGYAGATVLGDPALIFTRDTLPPAGDPRCIGLNVIAPNASPRPQDWGWEHLGGLVQTVRRLALTGCQFRPFAMTPEDIAPTVAVLSAAGVVDVPTFSPPDQQALEQYLTGCGLVISLRLHGAVLATAWGIPTLLIGYMEKADDFARSLGLERQLVPVREAREAVLAAALTNLQEEGEAGRQRAWIGARAARERIVAMGADIVARISRPAGRRTDGFKADPSAP